MEASSLNYATRYSRAPLIVAASVSTLGGLLFGYDNIVISGAIGYLRNLFHLDAAGVGWAAGCALIGCVVGCAGAGTVADFLGRKKGLALCAVCFTLSSCGMLFAGSLNQFVGWRLLGGLDCTHECARPLRRSVPDGNRGGNPGGGIRQHVDPAAGGRYVEHIDRMEVDVLRGPRAGGAFRADDHSCPGKPALADEGGPARAGVARAYGHQRP